MNRYKTGYAKGILYKGAAISAVLLICRNTDTQISLLKGNAVLVMLVLRIPVGLSLSLQKKKKKCPASLKQKKKDLQPLKNSFIIHPWMVLY